MFLKSFSLRKVSMENESRYAAKIGYDGIMALRNSAFEVHLLMVGFVVFNEVSAVINT